MKVAPLAGVQLGILGGKLSPRLTGMAHGIAANFRVDIRSMLPNLQLTIEKPGRARFFDCVQN